MSDCLYHLLKSKGYELNYRYYDIAYNKEKIREIVKSRQEEYEDNKMASKMTTEEFKKTKINNVLSDLERLGIKVK